MQIQLMHGFGGTTIRRIFTCLIFTLALAVFTAASSISGIIRVNANATGPGHDGASWSTAFLKVNDAVGAAAAGDEVWVASPTPASPAYVENIVLKAGVPLYGGFLGTETARNQRNCKTNVTVLDGGNNGNYVTFSYVVGAILDGFTLRNGTYGVWVKSGGSAQVSNCTLTGNTNGVRVESGTATLDGCAVSGNTSIGIYLTASSANVVVNTTTISGNPYGLYTPYGTARLASCVVSGNSSGLYVWNGGSATVNNCSFTANTSSAINLTGGSASVTNSIVAFNAMGIYRYSTSLPLTLSHNDVYGNTTNFTNVADPVGTNGNISTDPQFTGRPGDLHLLVGSPCINAGDDLVVTGGQTDVDGRPRTVGAHVDIGAFEYGAIRYVATSGNDSNDGSSWSKAKKTVGGALSGAVSGDEVWVAQGIYVENLPITAGAALFGGFSGTETARDQRNWKANVTVLDGGNNGNYVLMTYVAGPAVDGFTIRNGVYGVWANSGGAITVDHCRLLSNIFGVKMGGSSGGPCAITLRNCTVSGSTWGIRADAGTPTIVNCTFSGNLAAIDLYDGTPSIANTIVAFNGRGIYRYSNGIPVVLSHNDVFGNTDYDYYGIDDPSWSNGNVKYDPLFADPLRGDYHIQPASVCVDAGDDSVATSSDIDGQARKQGAHVDIGADESDGTAYSREPYVLRVKPSGNDLGDGQTWATAKRTISAALAAINSGIADDVWVAAGTYVETVNLKHGVGVYGGFAGTETARNQRNWVVNATTIDGAGHPIGPSVSPGEDMRGAAFDGFTLRNTGISIYELWYSETAVSIANNSLSGGDIVLWGNQDTVTDNTVVGGRIYIHNEISVFVAGNTVTGNTAPSAAIDVWTNGHVNVQGNHVYANPGGPGIRAATAGNVPMWLENNVVTGNAGGIEADPGGVLYVTNNVVGNNHASSGAGGIGVYEWIGDMHIVGNTVTCNSAPADGGGIVTGDVHYNSFVIANNIVAFNSSGVSVPNGDPQFLSHNCVYGNAAFNYSGVADPGAANGNLVADPRLADPLGGNYHIQPTSPAMNGGDDSLATGSDIDGQARVQGPHIDIGADESDGTVWTREPRIVYVKAGGSDLADGQSWATALRTVATALALSSGAAGDEVWVARGTYAEILSLPASLPVFGGFAGTETVRSQHDWKANVTVLDGGGSNAVVTSTAAGAVLDGFTVRNGTSGIWATGLGTIKVTNCNLTANGFGVNASDGGVTLANSTVSGNGTGVRVVLGTATIADCVISGNSGAGVSANGFATLADCVISGNNDGVSIPGGTTTINNCTIAGNTSVGVFVDGTPRISNCIIAFNNYGFSWESTGLPQTMSHNDVYGNTTANYLHAMDATGANGNISADPVFVNRAGVDFRLLAASPCVNAGADGVVTVGETDLDGKPRILGAHVDIGAFEYGSARYVSPSGNDANDGTSWSKAKRTIGGVLGAVQAGDDIWVATGTYVEPVDLKANVGLYGGFAGSETTRDQRDWVAHVTVLDGAGHAVGAVNGHCFGAALDGFALRNTGVLIESTDWAFVPDVTIANNNLSGASIETNYARAAIRGNSITNGHITAGVTVAAATVENNTVTGGSITAEGDGFAYINRNRIHGGGISSHVSMVLVVANNIVEGFASGDGIHAAIDGMTALITGNTVVSSGRGIVVNAAVSYQPIIADNIAVYNGTGLAIEGSPQPTISHNDIYANSAANYSGIADQTGTNGNFGADPLFVNAAAGDYHLSAGSPCRDTGDGNGYGSLDVYGSPRVQYGVMDVGAAESGFGYIRRVKADATGPTHDGMTWATAYLTIQDAISAGTPADEIWVALGRYSQALTVNGNPLYGGFAGTETSRGQRDWTHYISLIDQPVSLTGPMGVVDGFTVFGPIACYGEGVTLANTYLRGPLSAGDFAQVHVWSSRIVGGGISAPLAMWLDVQNSEITDSPDRGIYAYGDMAAQITGTTLQRCHGGGIYLHTSGRPVIAGNTIQDCQATDGAAIWCGGDNVEVSSNLITRNQASGKGGAVYLASMTFSMENNTLVANTATAGGGGIAIAPQSYTVGGTLANNIVAFNSSGILKESGVDPVMSHNDVFGSTAQDFTGLPNPTGVNGNISVDPLLVNRQQSNYHLSAASPCIDAGDNALRGGTTDYEGDPRVINGTVDIGADEYLFAAYSLEDVGRALRIAAGLQIASAGDIRRLDVVATGSSYLRVTVDDAVRLARKVGGADPNP